MQYDAATMGNHDFDLGMENFAIQLKHASFPILVSNYDFLAQNWKTKHSLIRFSKKAACRLVCLVWV